MFRKFLTTFLLILIPSTSFALTVNGDLTVTGKGFVGPLSAGQAANCGMSISGSTFSITQADGSPLSTTRPCRIGIRSNTSGLVSEAKFTSTVSFTFGAASDTDSNTWGITSSVDWSNAMPFFLGVIYDGTTPYFTISRLPHSITDNGTPGLCQKADTSCGTQYDVMILTTGLTLSNWLNLPITQVGWIQMSYATSGSAWTASLTNKTGFNDEYKRIFFTFPAGQNGATAGKYMLDFSGTAPVFANNFYFYKVGSDGMVSATVYLNGDGGTDGSGSVSSDIYLPYSARGNSSSNRWDGACFIGYNAGSSQWGFTQINFSNPRFSIERNSSASTSTTFFHSDFQNVSRSIECSLIYNAY